MYVQREQKVFGKEMDEMKGLVEEGKKSSVAVLGTKTASVISLVAGEAAIMIFLGVVIRLLLRPGMTVGIYIDALNIVTVISMILIVIAAAGQMRELGCAFKYCAVPDSEIDADLVAKSAGAVKLSMITAVLSGGIVTVLRVISLLYFPDMESLGQQILLAGAMTDLLCGMMIAVLLLPIYGRLKKL